jgi:lysophospholipase L1-like esterase
MPPRPSLCRRLLWYATRPVTVLLVIALAVALMIGLHRRAHLAAQAAARRVECTHDQQLAARIDDGPITAGTRQVTVLGDGIAEGVGLAQPREQSWPARLGRVEHWAVTVDARAEAGYRSGGYCGHQSVTDRATLVAAGQPDMVIVEAGLSDGALLADKSVSTTTLATSVRRVLYRLRTVGTVVVVGVSPRDKDGGVVNQVLQKVVQRHGVVWVPATAWAGADPNPNDTLSAAGNAGLASRLAATLGGIGS